MSTAELQPPCDLPQRVALIGVPGCGMAENSIKKGIADAVAQDDQTVLLARPADERVTVDRSDGSSPPAAQCQ